MSARATVKKKSGETRRGRGFSGSELREVGLSFFQALKLRLPVDQRRKTKWPENVKALKEFVGRKSKR